MLEDKKKDGTIDTRTVILENRDNPHGMAFYTNPLGEEYFYLPETNEVLSRDELILEIKDRVKSGYYDNPEVIDKVVDKLTDEFND